MDPRGLDVSSDIFGRRNRKAGLLHPIFVVAQAVQARTKHCLTDRRYEFFFVFSYRSIASKPGANSQDTSGLQCDRAPFEKAGLVSKVFAAFHNPDHVHALRFGLPRVRIRKLKLNPFAQASGFCFFGSHPDLNGTDCESSHATIELFRQPEGGTSETASNVEDITAARHTGRFGQAFHQSNLRLRGRLLVVPVAVMKMLSPKQPVQNRQSVVMLSDVIDVDVKLRRCGHVREERVIGFLM
jgi:hypothetical protein